MLTGSLPPCWQDLSSTLLKNVELEVGDLRDQIRQMQQRDRRSSETPASEVSNA